MPREALIAIAALLAAAPACSGTPSRPLAAATEVPPPAEPRGIDSIAARAIACPIGEPGTTIDVEDTDDGAAMVFVTLGDVGALRTQVFAMADLHNQIFAAVLDVPEREPAPGDEAEDDEPVHASGPGPRPAAGLGPRGRDERDLVVLVPSHARVESIAGGARLVFSTAADEIPGLRAEVRGEADAIEDACAWPD